MRSEPLRTRMTKNRSCRRVYILSGMSDLTLGSIDTSETALLSWTLPRARSKARPARHMAYREVYILPDTAFLKAKLCSLGARAIGTRHRALPKRGNIGLERRKTCNRANIAKTRVKLMDQQLIARKVRLHPGCLHPCEMSLVFVANSFLARSAHLDAPRERGRLTINERCAA
jgi:hypothetical protein